MTARDSGAVQGTATRETKRNIETAYLLSPMQQGMLFHTLYAPDSGVYFEQLSAELVGDLNAPAFLRAWQQVLDRHPILRSAFVWRRQERPVQAVYKELTLPIETFDWRDALPEEQERRLNERLAADRATMRSVTRAMAGWRSAMCRSCKREGGPLRQFIHARSLHHAQPGPRPAASAGLSAPPGLTALSRPRGAVAPLRD